MTRTNILTGVAFAAVLVASSLVGSAATITNFPAGSPPAVNGADIAQLVLGTNVTAPDPNDAIYMFSDRPAQGQSFTTGSNPDGYLMNAFTIQHLGGGGVVNYPSAQPLQVRITQLTGPVISVIHSETAAGVAFDNPTTDEFVRFTLDTPQILLPNTTYGFDTGMTLGGWAVTGNNGNLYGDGTAYSSGDNGIGNALADLRVGDRVFHVNLFEIVIPPVIPEPSTFVLLALGAGVLLGGARRQSQRGC